MRIAMWSGPRNLSTAMMYAFATRPEFAVWDEPFYGAYLAQSGLQHPLSDEILARYEHDPAKVAQVCLGPIPGGAPHFYQKHMTHHMLPGFPMDWVAGVTNVFLIRHPARVVASYSKKRERPDPEELGFHAQFEIYQRVRDLGQVPIVVDSADIRANPSGMLAALLEAIGLPEIALQADEMVHWPMGGIPEDGPWAKHWYGAVHRSSGFAGAEGPLPDLDDDASAMAAGLMEYYEALAEKRLTPA